MNSHLHVIMETKFFNRLKAEAQENSISLSEYCRLKLKKNVDLEKIERKIDFLIQNGNKQNR